MIDHRQLLNELSEKSRAVYGSEAYAYGGVSSLFAVLIDGLDEPTRRYVINGIKHLMDAIK